MTHQEAVEAAVREYIKALGNDSPIVSTSHATLHRLRGLVGEDAFNTELAKYFDGIAVEVYPNDKPLNQHPLYAYTAEHKPDTFIDALCGFYKCTQDDLKGKFTSDTQQTHRYAYRMAWDHILTKRG